MVWVTLTGQKAQGQNPRAFVEHFPCTNQIAGLRYSWSLRSICPELVLLIYYSTLHNNSLDLATAESVMTHTAPLSSLPYCQWVDFHLQPVS